MNRIAREEYEFYCDIAHHGNWKASKHHKVICEKLQQVADGKLKRLMIFMPPRHGKSMAVTETFPSYFLGRYPAKRVIEASYSANLAQRFGKSNREKVREFGNSIFGIELSKDKAAQAEFEIKNKSGGMLSVGVGGSITGQGADLLIIDDPIKNRKEAESPTFRGNLWAEYQNTLVTRLHPNAAIIIILTRWHEDDLAGRLLGGEYCEVEDWDIVSLPAICDDPEGDLIGRERGQALWPEHGYDEEWATAQKNAVGSYAWEALYQQNPSPPLGGIFKRSWLKKYDEYPNHLEELIQSWDLTYTDTDGSDYAVGQIWGRKGAEYYLLDQVRGKMDFTEQIRKIRQLSKKHPRALHKRIERAANGAAVITTLKKEIPGIIPVIPQGSKIVRANAVTPFYEAGNVYHPSAKLASWINDFEHELASFPNGKNDDQVDAMTQALSKWIKGDVARIVPRPKGR